MFDIPQLLKLFGSFQGGDTPLISGGGIGGGQTQAATPPVPSPKGGGLGGFLGNLVGGGGGASALAGGGGFSPGGLMSLAGNLGGSMLTKKGLGDDGIINDGEAKLAGAVKGAGTGAGIGTSILPGLGTLIGGGVGAIAGGIFGKGNEDEVMDQRRTASNTVLSNSNKLSHGRGASIANNSNMNGHDFSGYYAKGGHVSSKYKVEDGETMYADDNNPPMTDGNGQVQRIGENTFKFQGDKHSDSSGGIGVMGGDTPFEGNDGDAEPTGFVFSNKLKADPSNFLSSL